MKLWPRVWCLVFLTHGVVLQHVDLCCLYSYLRVSRRSFMAQILDGLRRSLVGIFVLSLRVASRAHTMRQRSAFNCPFLTLRNVSSCDKTKTGSTAWVTLFCNYSTPDREAEYCEERVCLCVCLSAHDHIFETTRPIFTKYFFACYLWPWLGPPLRRSDALCTSGFMDDVIFAHKPRLLDVAAQLKRSAQAALGLAINCAK